MICDDEQPLLLRDVVSWSCLLLVDCLSCVIAPRSPTFFPCLLEIFENSANITCFSNSCFSRD